MNRSAIIALSVCVCVLCSGIVGYMVIEDYAFFEALYMSVITVTTVGFGEVRPLSEMGRWFTTILIIIGFGALAYAGRVLVEALFEGMWKGGSEARKMKDRISRLSGHYIICGFGQVGAAAADQFSAAGTNFVIIEMDTERCQAVSDLGYLIIEGDATQEVTLMSAGVKSARGLVALLDSDPYNLYTVLTAREVNPTLHIIARAEDAASEHRILRAGADGVVSPYTSAGHQIAGEIIAAANEAAGAEIVQSTVSVAPRWMTIEKNSSDEGETLLDVSNRLGRRVLGLRRHGVDTILPDCSTVIKSADQVLLLEMGDFESPEATPEVPPKRKIVIIDDSPTTLRLYSRLFSRAGFDPLLATDGTEGLELIRRERPNAAVIDNMLPGLSGIEICRELRGDSASRDTHLILFTADERPETERRALDSGADAVVVKSADASALIATVVDFLAGVAAGEKADEPVVARD